MIRVTFLQKDGLLAGFECRGHAGYAPAGEDIVCAAVSVLTTTCVNAMETVALTLVVVSTDTAATANPNALVPSAPTVSLCWPATFWCVSAAPKCIPV